MKAQVQRDALLETLGRVKSAVPGKHTLPVITNILIQAKDGQLTLAGYDLETALLSSCEATIEKAGSAAVSPKALEDFLKQVQAEKVSIEVKGKMRTERGYEWQPNQETGESERIEVTRRHKELTFSIQADGARSTLPAVDKKDFPPIPEDRGKEFTLSGLDRGLREVSYAMSQDGIRPALNGVCLTPNGKKVELAASDGFRLAITPVAGKGLPEQVVLPAGTVKLLLKTMRGRVKGTSYKDKAGKRFLSFRQDGLTMVAQSVDGKFPEYRQLVPKGGRSLKVATDRLKQALKMVMAIKPSDGTVRLRTRGQTLLVSGKNNDTGQATEARVPARGRAKIAFNGSYLEDILSRSGETLQLRITGPQSPGVARNNGTIHVIMPRFVQW